jgi:methylenetetrahydrofolate--tRNA-(uracil-5-)-methyltransferase
MLSGIAMARELGGQEALKLSDATVIGSMGRYISTPNRDFQPMNATFGLVRPPDKRIRNKKDRYTEIAARSLAYIDGIRSDL